MYITHDFLKIKGFPYNVVMICIEDSMRLIISDKKCLACYRCHFDTNKLRASDSRSFEKLRVSRVT